MAGKAVLLAIVASLALAAGAYAALIVGTPRNDQLVGTPQADQIYALGGNDSIRARGGNDEIHGQGDGDRIKAGAGDDESHGGGGPDSMWAGRGADRQFGGPGDDVLHALADDDQMDGLDCGSGQDVAWLDQAERGLYRIANCEVLKIVVPTAEQLAEEDED
jgi:Ca2+-binding RTX toxin-like protein